LRAIGRTARIADLIIVPGFSIRQTGHLLLAEGIERGLSIAEAGGKIITLGYLAVGAVAANVYVETATGALQQLLPGGLLPLAKNVQAVKRPADALIDQYIEYVQGAIESFEDDFAVERGDFEDDVKKVTCAGGLLIDSVRSPFAHLFGKDSRDRRDISRFISFAKCARQQFK